MTPPPRTSTRMSPSFPLMPARSLRPAARIQPAAPLTWPRGLSSPQYGGYPAQNLPHPAFRILPISATPPQTHAPSYYEASPNRSLTLASLPRHQHAHL